MSLEYLEVQHQSQTLENIQHSHKKLVVSLFLNNLLIKFSHVSLLLLNWFSLN